MSDKTKIEWSDATWNPVTGCTKVSEGCRNCYAKTFAERFEGTAGHYFASGFKVTLRPDKLEQPYRWKRSRRIFVNSMSDLFHDDIPDDFIWNVFQVMARCPQHTFQILTKRPERMMKLLHNRYWRNFGDIHALIIQGEHREGDVPFLPNVWLGVSVENQKTANERIPLLLQAPAAIRFLSCEPLLGPVNLNSLSLPDGVYWDALDKTEASDAALEDDCDTVIDWVIAGGESGSGARPMNPEWVRSLRDQCQRSAVPFFFKQWGEWIPNAQEYGADPGGFNYEKKHVLVGDDEIPMCRAGKKIAGRMLDFRTWDEMPV